MLAVGTLVMAVLVGRAALALGSHDDSAGAALGVAAPASTSPTPSVASSSPSPSASASPLRLAPVIVAAETWVRAWLDTRGGQQAWLARLRPITNGELYDGLALPGVAATVPRGQVEPGAQVLTAADGVTSVRVPTTAGPMLVDLTPRDGSWVAVSNDRAGQ